MREAGAASPMNAGPASAFRDSNPIARQSTSSAPVVFPEHWLAHELLDGLIGLEIGAASHNPFGLSTRNVASPEGSEFYADEQRAMGVEPAPVDIWALGDRIPVPDRSEDFILSSHVLEHLPNDSWRRASAPRCTATRSVCNRSRRVSSRATVARRARMTPSFCSPSSCWKVPVSVFGSSVTACMVPRWLPSDSDRPRP